MRRVMKRVSGALFFVAAGMMLPASAFSEPPLRRISVTGEAEIRVKPDQVILSMTVETRDKELRAAANKNDQAVSRILAYVTREAGVEEKYVQTDYVSVTPEYENCSYHERRDEQCDPLRPVYYLVSKGIQIRLNDLEKYEDIVAKSLEYGVTGIDDIQFVTTQLRRYRDEAREMAAKAAQEKAQAVAGALGMKILKPVTVDLSRSQWFYGGWPSQRGRNQMSQNVMQSAASSGVNAATLSAGQINITAEVSAVFEME